MNPIRGRPPNQALGVADPRQTRRQSDPTFGSAFERDAQGRVQLKPLRNMPDSNAATLDALRSEHNALLAALRAAGWMGG